MQDCGLAWVGGFLGGLLYLLTMSCVVSLFMLRVTKNSDTQVEHGSTPADVLTNELRVARHGFSVLREHGASHTAVVGRATASRAGTATSSSGICGLNQNGSPS